MTMALANMQIADASALGQKSTTFTPPSTSCAEWNSMPAGMAAFSNSPCSA